MAIRVKPIFEPFARPITEVDPDKYVQPARSRAAQRMADDMEAYALGTIPGRSFLVAGHRGSGKTSAVNNAINEVSKRLAARKLRLRIADIRLHGPDLLVQDKAAAGEDVALRDTKQMLRQVALALYRRIADIFAEEYQSRLLGSGGSRARESAELAAQLRVDLDGAPEISLLRDYWEQADAVHGGVLYPDDPLREHRGLDELVALACAAQAYQLVIGELTVTEKGSDSAKQEEKTDIKAAGADVKDLLNPVLSALLGGGAGAAAFASTHSALAAIGSGILGLGLASGALQYSSSRSKEKSRSREITFLPDTKVESLDRMLPLLVERVRVCGIVPVFVVDELDKVTDLIKRIEDLVRHLKHFVTERAFFCFLTDRDFYEALAMLSTDQPYPKEHTYFSDRLLLYFAPTELHEYLSDALVCESAEDQQAAEVLRYILVHRSRSHPFDLRQKLSAFQDETDQIKLTTSEILNTPAYRLDITMQVAVEIVLGDKLILDRLESNPEFMLLACDALYYPSRTWSAGQDRIDLSQGSFVAYLCKRLGVEKVLGPEPRILLQALNKLADLLHNPSLLRDEAHAAGRFPGSVVETLFPDPLVVREGDTLRWTHDIFGRLLPAPAPPVPEAPTTITLPEKVKESMAPSTAEAAVATVTPPPVEIKLVQADVEADIAWIEDRAQYVRAASEDFFNLKVLAVEYRLIGITPTWDGVHTAIQRLKQAHGSPYPDAVQDADLVREYRQMIDSRWLGILQALLLSALLGNMSGGPDRWARWKAGLELLKRMIEFETASATEIDARLEELSRRGLSAALSHDAVRGMDAEIDEQTTSKDFRDILAEIERVPPAHLQAVTARAQEDYWKVWRARFNDALAGTLTFEPEWPDVACEAAQQLVYFPAPLLDLDLRKVTIQTWSKLVLLGLNGDIPRWVVAPAMAHLGFQDKLDYPVPVPVPEEDRREFRAWQSTAASKEPGTLAVLEYPSSLTDSAPVTGQPCLAVQAAPQIYYQPTWINWFSEGLGVRNLLVELADTLTRGDLTKRLEMPVASLPGINVSQFEVRYVCSDRIDQIIDELERELGKKRSARIVGVRSLQEALAALSRLRSGAAIRQARKR